MKIINAIHSQQIGGVDRVFQDYTEILSNLGHDVALVISDNERQNYQCSTIFKLKNISPVFDCFHLLFIFCKFKPDIVICHSPRIMKWMKILKKFYPFQSIGVNHGTTFKHSMHCDYAFNVNQQISNNLVNAGFDAKKSFIIPNVVNITKSYQEKTIKKIPVIAVYGRIERAKGFDVVIKACEILSQKQQDFKLKIGGFEVPGSSYSFQTLKDLASQCQILHKIDFVGTVHDKEAFFADVDILCVPSREETFGLPILEAFLHSTLVISSKTDGGNMLINDQEDGLLFEIENHQELATKLLDIFHNPSHSTTLTHNAYSKLVKEFNFDILGQKLTKILTSIF